MKNKYTIKVWIVFLLPLLCIILTQCVVNDSTGLLIIRNLSDNAVTDIKLGEATILEELKPGEKYNYWYFDSIEGELALTGVDSVRAPIRPEDSVITIFKDNPLCIFKTDFQYFVDIKIINSQTICEVGMGVSPGSSSSSTDTDFPAR